MIAHRSWLGIDSPDDRTKSETPHNQLWLEICALAADLIAWLQRLALDGELAVAEPKRLPLRIFAVAARLVHTGRGLLKIAKGWPWADPIIAAHHRLAALAAAP